MTVQGGTATTSTAPSVSVATPQMHEIGGKHDPRGARPKRTLQFSKNPKLEPLAEEQHKESHAGEVFVAQTFTHSKGTKKVITGKYLKYDKLAISVEQERNLQGKSKFHSGVFNDQFSQAVSLISFAFYFMKALWITKNLVISH